MSTVVDLVLPTPALRESYLGGLRELRKEGLRPDIDPDTLDDFDGHLAHLRAWAQGRELKDGWVPWTEHWMVADQVWAGRIAFRHILTPALERYGGHIGYEVRPSHRGRGVATRALGLLLERLRQTGPSRVLVTCDVTNLASRRVIEKNGGVLRDVLAVDGRDTPTMRWWIELRAPLSAP
jgi:predicted acetyltransferase